MKRDFCPILFLPFLAVILVALATRVSAQVDLSGSWVMDLTANSPEEENPCIYSGDGQIKHNGSTFTGSLVVSLVSGPALCPPEVMGDIDGTVDGDSVFGSVDGGQLGFASFSGSPSNSFAGTFVVSDGPFVGTDGTWLAVRPNPSLALIKSGTFDDESGDGFAQAGETISYSFEVTNTGNQTLSSVAVSDPLVSSISCPGGNPIPSLAPEATQTCTGSYAVTQADVDAGSRDNTATAAGEDPDGGPVSDSDSVTTMLPGAASVALIKSGTFDDDSGDGFAQAGETISYSFAVTNTGNQTLSSVAVSDPLVSSISCPGGNPIPSLAPDATQTCTGSYAVTQADVDAGSRDNTATAAGEDPDGGPVSDSDTVTTMLPGAASVALIKSGTFDDESGDGFAQAGETISYSFEVTNTGNQTLSSVAVSDPLVSSISCPGGNPIPSLAPEATQTCTGSYAVTQADVDAGSRDNTATAAGEDPDGGPVSDSDSATTMLPGAVSVALIKSGTFDDDSGDGFAQAGETISYSFEVTNTGNQTLSSVAVSDPLVSSISCPGGNPIPSLAPEATETCTGSYAVTQDDVDAGSRDNTATAAGEDPDGAPVSVSHTTSTTLTAAPEVSATKTSSFDLSSQDNDGSEDLTPGDDLTYAATIINDGSGEATGVIFDDTPDPNTGLVVGSVTTTRGTVNLGNTAGDTAVRVTVGTLASGESVAVTFDVTIDDPLPEGVTSIINQGVVSGDNFASVVTDDPDTASDNDGTADHVNSPPAPPTEVPSLSQWGLLLLMLLLLSTVVARRLH